jgi:hypothetical protein
MSMEKGSISYAHLGVNLVKSHVRSKIDRIRAKMLLDHGIKVSHKELVENLLDEGLENFDLERYISKHYE